MDDDTEARYDAARADDARHAIRAQLGAGVIAFSAVMILAVIAAGIASLITGNADILGATVAIIALIAIGLAAGIYLSMRAAR